MPGLFKSIVKRMLQDNKHNNKKQNKRTSRDADHPKHCKQCQPNNQKMYESMTNDEQALSHYIDILTRTNEIPSSQPKIRDGDTVFLIRNNANESTSENTDKDSIQICFSLKSDKPKPTPKIQSKHLYILEESTENEKDAKE